MMTGSAYSPMTPLTSVPKGTTRRAYYTMFWVVFVNPTAKILRKNRCALVKQQDNLRSF